MSEKFSIKAIQEMSGLSSITSKEITKYARSLGMLSENGEVTEKGLAHLEFRSRKSDGAPYLAITETFAKMFRQSQLDEMERKTGHKASDFERRWGDGII